MRLVMEEESYCDVCDNTGLVELDDYRPDVGRIPRYVPCCDCGRGDDDYPYDYE